ncbi:hypothetical protein ES711_05050 [Gelidibacter salicanalis]|uniref:Transcription regulator BetR N-terminal domain-containing protein n=1 Tax=Gelidibacter salicanalis TaxID=291193 RepID=A0A5C7ANP3_9FLAO|nr:hypothetical protein [Gelidibacter salicanalis]TXE09299.1 hypothetical protein ES711_05050 [Gelidibacter salicanalis]
MQRTFISFLREKSNNTTSFVDEIATVLDIGYDAAYRRINSKTHLTLEEAVRLAKFYQISLNSLFEVGSQNSILAELSPNLTNAKALEEYFIISKNNLLPMVKLKSATILYSAKELPIFHTLKDSYIAKYKMYVWLKDVDIDMAASHTTFEEFLKVIPQSLIDSANNLSEVYKDINITEFWNDMTINSTIQQIVYYYESGLLSKDMALLICNDTDQVLRDVEQQAIQQSITGSQNKTVYNLYKTDLHSMNNVIMVNTPYKKVFFTPFTLLSYFKIEHQPTCNLMYEFFEKQKFHSKLLVNAGERDRTQFFNGMHQKIDKLREHILKTEFYSIL